ncbi:MAG: hypothetical protein K1X86_02765 [Ignavibacteria bacterium]|nr:hypothetical protein [Ignavibacteria bacterium]
MVLPSKHIKISESYIGIGGFVMSLLTEPLSIDVLWRKLEYDLQINQYPTFVRFEDFMLTLDLLFMLSFIELDKQGRIINAAN